MPVILDTGDYAKIDFATHRMRLSLPPGATYGISMKTCDYAMRIFLDDREIDCVGSPGTTPETSVPHVLEKSYFFTPEGSEVRITVQASNFVHGNGGCQPPYFQIGSAENIAKSNAREAFLSAIIMGCLLTSCFYHLALFCLSRKRVTTLLFSGCCLLLALMNKKLLFMVLPDYSWFVAIRFEYAVHFLTFAAFTWFLSWLFPTLMHRFVARAYYALTVIYGLTLFLDTRVFTHLLEYFEYASLLMIAYLLIRLAWTLKGGKAQNILGFIGMLAVCVFGVNDLLYHRDIVFIGKIGGQVFTAPIGMLFFVFCYALILSIEYAETERSMLEAQENERRLAVDNEALDRLNRMKGELIATMSHETRTPLAVLSGYAELISMELRRKGVDEQTAKDLDGIAEEAQRIAGLMDELQHYARRNDAAFGRTRLAIADVVDGAARLYTPILARKGTRLIVDIPGGLPPIYASADVMTQLLFNLLQNAGKHTEAGSVRISAEENGDFIAVSVTDTGSGVPMEILPRAFERGVSGDAEGSGLGLAICKEIIDANGGSIEICSEAGKGTTVRFTLPVLQEGGKNES